MYNVLLMMGQGNAAGKNPYTTVLFFGLILVVFYFFMVRPQQKRQREARLFRESLKKGDKVVTNGGIYGEIIAVEEQVVMLEVANNVVLRVDKNVVQKDFIAAS